ncbi:MAG: uracil-DNA glycosylase [Candidatus Omnitrophica bacterium]|nr:uracil-DNA glycosylase [Candidatus Omnitrophota bacterium]MCK5393834.1 uracil-DNA glycosylase [Candidatus Omnitrophota bacterium]
MNNLKNEILNCKKCELFRERLNPVIGEGNLNTEIMFIGEAPGANEDKTGKPFCGRSGDILDELLMSSGMNRQDIYIANIIKCRPPGNRNPKEEEIRLCAGFLDIQIDLIKPKIICCLGNFSTSYVMKKFNLNDKIQGISKIHGQVFFAESSYGKIKVIPFYHPAVVVYNMNMKKILAIDFSMLKNMLK